MSVLPRCILQALLLTHAVALIIGSASSDPSGLDSPSLESSTAGAADNNILTPAFQHNDFGSLSLNGLGDSSATTISDPALQLSSFPAVGDSSQAALVRREPPQFGSHDLSRRIKADNVQRENMDTAESEEDTHTLAFKEDPQYTPEAIFANKKYAPEVAEFLGRLAQRSRVHRKENYRAAKEAGLISEGRAKVTDPHDADDSEDIEDMKKSLTNYPKRTPLAHFFEKIDARSSARSWTPTECSLLMKNITDKYSSMAGKSQATWATTGPAGNAGRSDVHTGLFFRHWKLDESLMKAAARKLRLGVLSFLATQDAGKVKLHIWTDLDKSNGTIRNMLGPIAHHPEFMDAIKITTFDPKVELQSIPATLAREVLDEHIKKDTMPEIRPDLYRSVILYNYGGLWMDADTVLMQDVAPLLGEDWAYLVNGNEGSIDGALLSASRPKSHFANAYLIGVAMHQQPVFPDIEKPKKILQEIFHSDPAHAIMHVLPPCFMDSDATVSADTTAVLSSDVSLGSDFFGKPVSMPYREYFSLGIQDARQDNSPAEASVLQDESFNQQPSSDNDDDDQPTPTSPVWAYHWRGHFAAPWARGSLADVAERTFIHKLGLQKHKWN